MTHCNMYDIAGLLEMVIFIAVPQFMQNLLQNSSTELINSLSDKPFEILLNQG